MGDIQLIRGDCLEEMRKIPAGSVDLVLCDLPYGTTACKWDSVIPFKPLWEQWERITKQNALIVLFGAEPFSSAVRMSNIKRYRYDWIWKKRYSTGFMNAKKEPLRNYENIMVFYAKKRTKATRPVYNPQMAKGKPYINKRKGSVEIYDHVRRLQTVNTGTRYPVQVLEFGRDPDAGYHPTQKPVKLLEYLIKTYTNEGATVLDNCMGSGSTGVACVNTGRNFIGIEKEEKYYTTARERIARAGSDRPTDAGKEKKDA